MLVNVVSPSIAASVVESVVSGNRGHSNCVPAFFRNSRTSAFVSNS